MKQIKNIFFSKKNLKRDLFVIFFSFLAIVGVVKAGNLDSPGSPGATMYTLNDIYQRLITNQTADEGDHLFKPTGDPVSSFHTLKEIYESIPTIEPSKIKLNQSYLGVTGTLTPDGGTAGAADLFNDKTANLTNDWNLDTGTLNLACNTGTFDGTGNKVSDAYDGGGNGNNRWCMKDTGNAAAGDMLSGKIGWVDGMEVTGMMENIGQQNFTPGTAEQTISEGYHNGTGKVSGDADLVSGNIKSGINIFGVAGDSNVVNTTSGDSSADNLLFGKKAWVDGSEITGLMPFVGTQILTPGTSNQDITLGYHNGLGYVEGDADLVSGNIKNGANIFGVAGDSNVVNTTSGDAIADNLLFGKKAWVDGSEVTGNMTNVGQQIITPGTTNQTITLGYHNGTGYAQGDANLVSGNIKSNVSIFGVNGDSNVVNTSTGDAIVGNILSGKKAWVDGLEVTGNASIFTYGDNDASKVLTSATGNAGTYIATNLNAGTVKSSTTFGAGLTGDYPSTTYPLSGDTGATDATAAEICNTDEAWTKAGVKMAGTLSPTAMTIGAGNTYCGVAGTLNKNEYNGTAGSSVLDYAFYPLTTTVPGFMGGVDDYNNSGTNTNAPADTYSSGTWTSCSSGDHCGTSDANADKKDPATGLVWSVNMDSANPHTWFWANNCYEPGTPENPDGGEGGTACDANGDNACKCVKKPDGSKVGCEQLGDGLWRTPTQKELMQGYVDGSWRNLSSAGYSYWSSTTYSGSTQNGWAVYLNYGSTYHQY